MMTTLDTNITAPPVVSLPKQRKLFGKNVWAIADQVLISGSNFVTMILVARAIGAAEFGTFSLVYSVLLLANILQSTLITQPHNVLASTRHGTDFGRFTFSLGLAQIVLVLLEAALVAVATAIVWKHNPSVAPMLLALVPGIVGWQLQEFVRRILYTQSRFAEAFLNDCLSYGLQTVAVIALWAADNLHGEHALYCLAITSLTAAAFGLFQLRDSLVPRFDMAAVRESWNFGKWLTGGELLQWGCSLQMYLYLSAIILGTAAAGELKAAQILFGPTRILAFYLGSVLPMRFARALASGGNQAVHEELIGTSKRVLPWLGLYALLVAILARPLLQLVYRDEFAGEPLVLAIYSAAAFVEYVQVIFTSALSAKRMTRSIFYGQSAGLVVTALVSWWIIHYFGAEGAPTALTLSTLIITILFYRYYKRSMSTPIGQA
jgi:O-antigen/teichoic acid export membrane protein